MLKKIFDYFLCLYKKRKCKHFYIIDNRTKDLITNKISYIIKCRYCGDEIKIESNDKG